MPTILFKDGWRLFFYANELNEPPHIHARKGDMECKFWLQVELFEIEESYSYNLSVAARRQIRRIIFENFDYLAEAYRRVHGGKLD